ncbi:MAG TPA: hypothetical protein DHN29_07370 [Cytophagales bacterium]|nr:hypothetical protein [Cytophagales bacterium]|tara:strand:- start:613 stop:831 length:219 start_codon:yes stop_codon:yes gene_type:complete
MINDPPEFCKTVEKLVKDDIYDSYIDAVLHVCDEIKVEPFVGARLLSQPIKEKIRKEGQDINLLPRTGSLPL